MDIYDRLITILETEEISTVGIAEKTGTKKDRWIDIKRKKVKIRVEDLQQINKVFPEYEVWLMTGREYPEDGQISPKTKLSNS